MNISVPFMMLSGDELQAVATQYGNISPQQQALLVETFAPMFLSNVLAPQFGLPETTLRGICRLLAELVVGLTDPSRVLPRISKITGADENIAQAIFAAIESGLLAPLSLTFASLPIQDSTAAPSVVSDAQGREGLRYPNLESLLNDLEPLSAEEKMRFLNDVRPFNRVLVMEALSQLKMGADAQGNPLSFRALLASEAPMLTPQDWADALGTDPDALLEAGVLPSLFAVLTPSLFADLLHGAPSVRAIQVLMEAASQRDTLADSVRYTPLCAMVAQKSPAEAATVIDAFLSLSDDARALATSAETVTTIGSLIAANTLPATHAVAAARTAYFLATGQVQPSQVASLMERVGLSPQASSLVQDAFASLYVPPEPAPAPTSTPPPRPVVRRAVPMAPKPMTPRGIIDLRKDRTV